MATTNAALSAISDYWNLRAEGYSLHTRDELEGDAGRRLAALFSETLPLPEGGGRLLDVGCGPGLFSIAAAKLGWSVTGIDLSQRMLDEARANAQEAGRPAIFQIGNAEAPDFAPESFDAVFSGTFRIPKKRSPCGFAFSNPAASSSFRTATTISTSLTRPTAASKP